MPLSVSTNVGAMLARLNLGKTNRMMDSTQIAITTGLRVSIPKQDASSYAIAQNMRGDISGLGAVKTPPPRRMVKLLSIPPSRPDSPFPICRWK